MQTQFGGFSAGGVSVEAPKWPALGAVVAACLAVAALFPATSLLWVAVAGYALGALVAPVFTVLDRFGRRRAAQNPFYIPSITTQRVVFTALTVGILTGALHAWFVATELAKL